MPTARSSRAKRGTQLRLGLKKKPGHGGARKNAGRKSASGRRPVARLRRPTLGKNHAVHVNWRVLPHVWNLRSRRAFRVMLRAFARGAERFGARVTHISVMANHLHLIAEASSAAALGRAMQGLAIRLAKGLNKLMDGRHGKVFADRFHAHPLGSPIEARNAIDYVMNNARIHAQRQGLRTPSGPDEYALAHQQLRDPNAAWRRDAASEPPVREPEGWLLREGWMRGRPGRHALE